MAQEQAPKSPAAPTNLPMFYSSPRPLDRVNDADKRVAPPKNFRFAGSTNAIPILVDEFPMAAAYYPIVFADGPIPVPAAVVGLKNDENLLLDRKGQWLEGAYIPAYIRRYPFILMDDAEQKQFVLCIDSKSDMVNSEDGYRLFENGEPSDFTKSAMDFCIGLRQQGELTDDFVKALKEYDLLMTNDAQMDLKDGSRLQLSGFLIVNPQKFDSLPDNVFLQWRRKGWLGLIYAQLLSSHRWQNLVDLMRDDET